MKTRLLYLLPLLLTVALIVFGEALGDLWKEDVKALFQQNKWLLLAFVLLLALLGFLWERQQRSNKPAAEEVDKDQYDEAFVQFRKNLLEQYQTRLASKTGRRLPVNLTAKSTNYGFDPERAKVFLTSQTIESEDIASEMDKILKKFDRLLLIGDPGAGKTTILLYAAINILNDAREPKLPLILNLATWSEGRDFAEWYAQNIAHSYSLSPVFVRELLRRNAVVPFFDGFDEVAEEYRDDCFQKMAAYFGDQSNRQLIVSSRKKEYAAASADAPVYAEIEVQPLSLSQIKKALSENAQSQAADRALLHALERDRWLAEAVETPFYLNTASFLFGKSQRTLADFPFEADSTEGRQDELVEIFVAEQVPEGRDKKHLHFLASKMEEESFLVFELAKMQPGWSGKRGWYRFIGALAIILTFGIFIGLVFGLAYGLLVVLFSGLMSLNNALFGNLPETLEDEIKSADIQVWRWSEFKKGWKQALIIGLVCGLVCGVLGCNLGYLFDKFIGDLDYSLDGLFLGGLVFGMVCGLVCGLVVVGTSTSFLLHLSSPYERFLATFRNYWWCIPLIILALLLSRFAYQIREGTFSGVAWTNALRGVSFWLNYLSIITTLFLLPLFLSGFSEHLLLRLLLYLEGKMPLRVVTFMDRMTEQLIFEDNRRSDKKGRKRRGATWRFRHKILQDYFVNHSTLSS